MVFLFSVKAKILFGFLSVSKNRRYYRSFVKVKWLNVNFGKTGATCHAIISRFRNKKHFEELFYFSFFFIFVNFYLSIQIKVAGSYLNFIFFREVSINFPLSMWTMIPHFSLSPKYVLWWYYTIYL